MIATPTVLAEFLESNPEPAVVVDAAGVVVVANTRMAVLLGCPREYLIGRTLDQHVRGISRRLREIRREVEADIQPPGRAAMGLKAIRADDTVVDVEVDLSLIQGTTTLVWVTVRDVTARVRAHASAELRAAIVESTDVAIFTKDRNGVITDWNRAAQNLFGWSRASVVGRSAALLMPPGPATEFDDILRRLECGERLETFDTTCLHRDGQLVPVAVTVSSLIDAVGKLIGSSTIARDITDRLHATQLEATLTDTVQRQRQAVELNDDVLQLLVVAESSLALNDQPAAARAIDRALAHARTLITNLLADTDILSGTLTRSAHATYAAPTAVTTPPGKPCPTLSHRAKRSVLITDDDPDIRSLVHAILDASAEFRVVAEAADGRESVDTARDLQPDVILLDLSMPGMDGLTALPLLKQVAPASSAIVLSAFDRERMGPAARDLGADGYIEKTNLVKTLIPSLVSTLAGSPTIGTVSQAHSPAPLDANAAGSRVLLKHTATYRARSARMILTPPSIEPTVHRAQGSS